MVPRAFLMRLPFALALLLTGVMIASAQEDTVTVSDIFPGSTVTDTITASSFFDRWEFTAMAGEEFYAEMQAADGLAPLLGLQAPDGDVIAASNQFSDGSVIEATPNDRVELYFDIPADGLYGLIATRADREAGTTTGSYTLTLTRIIRDSETDAADSHLDVTFRCGADMAASALGIRLMEITDPPAGALEITVYGLDGFQPVLRLGGNDGRGGAPCILPDPDLTPPTLEVMRDGDMQIYDAESITGITRHLQAEAPYDLRLSVGSRDGSAGTYLVRITGLSINKGGEMHMLHIQNGPYARGESVYLWMQREGAGRLDPLIFSPEALVACADIGLRTCQPPLVSTRVTLKDADAAPLPYRLDAAVLLRTDSLAPATVELFSGNPFSTGTYTVWILGTLPAQQTGP